jgi:hypothetical protein
MMSFGTGFEIQPGTGGDMPYSIISLILLAVALLALLDMGLGRRDPYFGDRKPLRLGLREFLTRPLPLFLFGIGAAMLPVQPAAGAGLLLLAGALALFGPGAAGVSEGRA